MEISVIDDDAFDKSIDTWQNLNTDTSADMANAVLLLYLNKHIFQNQDRKVSRFVKKALENNIKIIIVHEQDSSKGFCEFDQLICQTPADLLALGIYSDIAIPLYTTKEYRKVTLHLILEKMSEI